ncbi:MAG: hypothetical protein H0V17_23810 [Deltaproteobacteria bacterium]|nr:hypothetical protein [Deltaproteobacteria bacterium]
MKNLSIGLVAALSLISVAGCKKKGGAAGEAMAKMEEFSKAMCDCKDKACADKVNADMSKWGTEMAKSAGAKSDDKPDPEMAKKSADVMTKYTECMTKMMMAGAGTGVDMGAKAGDMAKAGDDMAKAGSDMAKAGGDMAKAGGDAMPEDVTPNAVTIEFTGKYKAGDAPGDEWPVMKVTNNSKRKLFFLKSVHYFYDKDGKQLGRTFAEMTMGAIEPGKSEEKAFGESKAKQPKGTEKIQVVFVGGNFFDKIEWKGDEKALAPDTRAMK